MRQALGSRGLGHRGGHEQRPQVLALIQELERETPVGAQILHLVEDDGIGEDRRRVHPDRVGAFGAHRDHGDAAGETGDLAPEAFGLAADELAKGILRVLGSA